MKIRKAPTYLAEALDAVADKKVQHDRSAKKVLADKGILAWILKKCAREFGGVSIADIRDKYIEGEPDVGAVPVMPDVLPLVQGIGTEDELVNEGMVRYDIRFVAMVPDTGERIEMIINVEAQRDFNLNYPLLKRVIYYGCRLVSSQKDSVFTKSDYGKIKKCMTIWVVMNPPKVHENTITRYSITESHMVGAYKEDKKHYDLMEAVVICLSKEDKKHYDELLNLLGTLLSERISKERKKEVMENDFRLPMSENLEREVSQMCNLSEGIWDESAWVKSVKVAKNFLGMGLSVEKVAEGAELPLAAVQEIVDGKEPDWIEYYYK